MPDTSSIIADVLSHDQKKVAKALKKANKHAKKRNRLLKQQYQQAQLDYELAERRYLIEKSALQPTFRLSLSEFLTCKPDFVNDPEQASEAKFLVDNGIGDDQRVLRIIVEAKGGEAYMRPNIVINQGHDCVRKVGRLKDERILAMNESTFFINVERLELRGPLDSMVAYFVYQDRTTLPVLLKYRLTPRADTTLLRWDAVHLDTVFANSKQTAYALITHAECEKLFVN